MELSDIDARIAQLKEQIALKEAAQKQLKEAYHNPYSKYHYGYIFDAVAGDRSGLDKEAAEEAAYQKLLMEQAQADKIRAEQTYNTAYENKLNRDNAKEIASNNVNTQQADKDALIQKEYDFAQIELDAAKDKLDIDNPDSVAALKKAVKKANYWGKQLPKDYGFELEMLPDDASLVDSKSVRIKKKVDKANALLSREGTNWKDEHYNEASALSEDQEIPEVTRLQLAAKVANKGEGAETKAEAWRRKKQEAKARYDKMKPSDQRTWKKNNPKMAKAIGVV